ncbi:TIGR03557 family F420-dependent LLM class oxidoreductase [Candidatus Halobonum tyrrellensis]|uniref:G6PDH family F420-dependent oxidoreductase n=1 Tax=Candidatus Halobonum tyrrellensis G22 TaxID=1324957 RepID=V4HIK8_9EURY|nr:TIGR03557 family F420-dependent LLM class oxidoreductase [Candidatus Halobonum tyrrellensis]ESP87764.1 G6PDH family F420-dependent oxidoreductase [Candidatus Halobonum tyrrellensis G22]
MSDTAIGYTLSSEEFGPNELVDIARSAEEAGFEFLSAADHVHPWLVEQGQSPFVWGTLGGVAEATDEVDLGVGVSAPAFRMHPVITAQAVATAAAMVPDRDFYFGVGTGENLNEHVSGQRWPEMEVRMEMLEECVEVIRKLWTGRNVSHHGEHYTVENAKLFTLPDELPEICLSAFGEKAAEYGADHADGFWTTGPQGDLLDVHGEAGGPAPDDGPAITQISVCYADSEAEAVSTAHENWRQGSLPGELNQELPTPVHFEQASRMISEDDIREGSTVTSRDPDDHIESIQECIDAGFDHVYVHQIGDEQGKAIDFYEAEVLPSFQ